MFFMLRKNEKKNDKFFENKTAQFDVLELLASTAKIKRIDIELRSICNALDLPPRE